METNFWRLTLSDCGREQIPNANGDGTADTEKAKT
jgi:hypothetical protein